MKDNTEIRSTFNLLKQGEEEIKLSEKYRNAILLLGKTGSGKSTFTQWIAGDNSKLISVNVGIGEFIIVDNNKISNTTIESKTIFPELFVDANTNTAFYDCPGFEDSRSTANDIATTYFIKKVADHIKSIKLIFIVNYSSVRIGVDRKDFLSLLMHASNFIKDIDKFHNSIAVIATKVDNHMVKQGKSYTLISDDSIIETIARFFEEVKKYLQEKINLPDISNEKHKFYENAIKFINILLLKKDKNYTKIGIFRRPDEPGPVTNISLLQEEKAHIAKIIHENLNFTTKDNSDFGYTISEKSKLDINDLVEEINENIWSDVGNVAEKIRKHYYDMVEHIRRKIKSFVNNSIIIPVNRLEAEIFVSNFTKGQNITSNLVKELKSLKNPEELVGIIDDEIGNLNIGGCKDNILNITKQGKYFNFLQSVSNRELKIRPWVELFKDLPLYFPEARKNVQNDIEDIEKKINDILNNTKKITLEHYNKKMKSIEIQKIPVELKKGYNILSNLAKEIENLETVNDLFKTVQTIYDDINSLGIKITRNNVIIIANRVKYRHFLQFISNKKLSTGILKWTCPFKDAARFLKESEMWYTFLNSLYSKFSGYEIQKNRGRYDVADIEDWGKSEKSKGIVVTKNNFQKFLSKIVNHGIANYNSIKNISPSEFQLEELNHILYLTLKHNVHISCVEPYVFIKGSYFGTQDILNLLKNVHDDDCKNLLSNEKYKFINIFADNTVFIDQDIVFEDLRLPITMIAPKWEIIGTRIVNLNGSNGKQHLEFKARHGSSPGKYGADGLPGSPGGSGGTFFGIGDKFVNGKSLLITANGGNGSSGQDGGNGGNGKNGTKFDISVIPENYQGDIPCSNQRIEEFDCAISNCEKEFCFDSICPMECNLKIFGGKGTPGGSGGNGGHAGKGGNPGDITLFEFNGNSNISKNRNSGKNGNTGRGGNGGTGGKNGDDLDTTYSRVITDDPGYMYAYGNEVKINNRIQKGNAPLGKRGKDGANSKGMKDAKAPNIISKLYKAKIINEYKSYLRENLNDRFKKYPLFQFLNQFDSNNSVKSTYDILGLIDELRSLEEQFYNLNKSFDFLPFYQSLLSRISEYAKDFNNLKNLEYKKVLNYLYTTTLSKIHSLKDSFESDLMINITGDIDLLKEDINILKNSQNLKNKVDVINHYKQKYKNGIDMKIKEAENFIEIEVTPEIDNINNEIENKVDLLTDEVIELQKRAVTEEKKLYEAKRKLEDALVLHSIFSFLKITGQAVSFLGPYGQIAGSVINIGNSVLETFTSDDPVNINNTLELPKSVSSLNSLLDKINIGDQKIIYFNQLLNEISQEINKYPEKLSVTSSKIENIKIKLNNITKNKFNFDEFESLEEELVQELKNAEEKLVKTRRTRKARQVSTGQNSDIALQVIQKHTKNAELLTKTGVEIYKKYKDDKRKLNEITKIIEKAKDKFHMLKRYERMIYNIITPIFKNMKNNLDDIKSKLDSKSKVTLEITKWKIQSALKDAIWQVQQLTQGFSVSDDVTHCIKKLIDAMTTLINLYDHIQNYKENQEFANYIADISSTATNNVHIVDQELRNSVNYLDISIRSNIVLQRYQIAINSFKQFVFPVAHNYFKQLKLPSELQIINSNNNTKLDDLTFDAARQIEHIQSKLKDYKISITKHDGKFGSGEFTSNRESTQPFFVWKNKEYKNMVSRLLSGKEVIVKADIETSLPQQDAIKFNIIQLDFKSKNNTKQFEINNILKAFNVSITHLGNSYYRYNDKTYLITTSSQDIWYYFEKNEKNEPVHANDVYWKIKNGDFMLSPYALWRIKLVKLENKKNYSFTDLERFKNEIDLELGGYGHYINKGAISEDLMVEKYYNAIDTFDYSGSDVNQESSIHFISQYNDSVRNKRSIDQELVITDDENSKYLMSNYNYYNITATNSASSISSPINALYNWLKESSIALMSNILTLTNIMPTTFITTTAIPDKMINDNNEIYYDALDYLAKVELNEKSVFDKNALKTLFQEKELNTEEKIKFDNTILGNYSTRAWQSIFDIKKFAFFNDKIRNNSEYDGNTNNLKKILIDEGKSVSQYIQDLDIYGSLMLANIIIRSVTGEKYKQKSILSPIEKRALDIRDIKQRVYEGLQEMAVLTENYNSENLNVQGNELSFYLDKGNDIYLNEDHIYQDIKYLFRTESF